MKTILTAIFTLVFSTSLLATDIVCDAPDGTGFPEKPMSISLNPFGADTLTSPGDDPLVLKSMESNRLSWNIEIYSDFSIQLDARNQVMHLIVEGEVNSSYPLACSNVEKAELEMTTKILAKLHDSNKADEAIQISDVPRDAKELSPAIEDKGDWAGPEASTK